MASEYIGVNGVARKVPTHYIGVDGVARNVKSGYVGVDGVARLFFAPVDEKAVLEVKKITANTTAGETTYENEEFLILDIYPKPYGTVKVTYGDLTKTIYDTSGAESPNAQSVFFGTFNGVSDSVATPASGTLTIEGDYVAYGCGAYAARVKATGNCACITAVVDVGAIEYIAPYAFCSCEIPSIDLPDGLTSIGTYAFYSCANLVSISLPDGLTSIGSNAFYGCDALTSISIPSGITTIRSDTFANCDGLVSVNLPNSLTEIESNAFQYCSELISLTLPNGLESVGGYAFQGCTKLNNVVIPASVTYLGVYSFDCYENADGKNAGTYYVRSTVPPRMEVVTSGVWAGAFGVCNTINCKITIVVPAGCLEAYKAAEGWASYASPVNAIVEG